MNSGVGAVEGDAGKGFARCVSRVTRASCRRSPSGNCAVRKRENPEISAELYFNDLSHACGFGGHQSE